MSSVTQPLIHGQEASGMEAALAPWFQGYDTMSYHGCSFTFPLITPKVPGRQRLPPRCQGTGLWSNPIPATDSFSEEQKASLSLSPLKVARASLNERLDTLFNIFALHKR